MILKGLYLISELKSVHQTYLTTTYRALIPNRRHSAARKAKIVGPAWRPTYPLRKSKAKLHSRITNKRHRSLMWTPRAAIGEKDSCNSTVVYVKTKPSYFIIPPKSAWELKV